MNKRRSLPSFLIVKIKSSKGDNIKLIIERNNLSKSVYVGDTEGDLKASRFAGIPFVYAKYGFGNVSDYDHVIEKFDNLLSVF